MRWTVGSRVLLHPVLSMIGRGTTGLVPLATIAIATNQRGLDAGGRVAALLAIAYVAGEIADFQGQRDIARSEGRAHAERALGFRSATFLLIAPVALACGWNIAAWPQVAAFIFGGAWLIFGNTYAGVALQKGDFRSLAVAPSAGLAVTFIAALTLPRFFGGLLGYALSFHLGRAIEIAYMIRRTSWIRPGRFAWRAEFLRARHLLYGSLASTVAVRSMTPLTMALAGPVAAGVFAVATQIYSAFAIIPLALATTAFQRSRGVSTHREATSAMQSSLRMAVLICAALLLPACVVVAFGARRFLGYADTWMIWTVVLILASAMVEPWMMFRIAALQLTFQDSEVVRKLLIHTMSLTVVLIAFTRWLGPLGLGFGMLVGRLLLLPLLWIARTPDEVSG
jgi:hypothetical protein